MSQINDVLDRYRALYRRSLLPTHDDVLAAVQALEVGMTSDDTLRWIFQNWPELEKDVAEFRTKGPK